MERRLGHQMWPVEARVLLHAPAERIAGLTTGVVEPVDERSCLLTLRGDDLHVIAVVVAFLDVDFDVLDPPELRERLRDLARRLSSRI